VPEFPIDAVLEVNSSNHRNVHVCERAKGRSNDVSEEMGHEAHRCKR
jgi:hypothetical protein